LIERHRGTTYRGALDCVYYLRSSGSVIGIGYWPRACKNRIYEACYRFSDETTYPPPSCRRNAEEIWIPHLTAALKLEASVVGGIDVKGTLVADKLKLKVIDGRRTRRQDPTVLDRHDGTMGEFENSDMEVISVDPAFNQLPAPLDAEHPYYLVVEEETQKVDTMTSEKPQRRRTPCPRQHL
jgi:hypothetical protein